MTIAMHRDAWRGLPSDFWERVRPARRHLLMLDYDGTLVAFREQPAQARLPEPTRELLRRIVAVPTTTVAIFSGRRIAELEQLLAGLPVHLVGEHGWDERTIAGHHILHPLPGEAARVLGHAARAAREYGLAEFLERKRCSLTLHTRALGHEEAERIELACRRLWGETFQRSGLRLTRIAGGIELRALACHEGTAVARLIRTSAPGTLPVYVGDDLPDEEVFYQLLGHGLAIKVGPSERGTLAPYALATADDVAAFLGSWNEMMRAAA